MSNSAATRYRSKTLATWLALLGGSVGLHRFYLYGWRDRWGWLTIPPTLLGLYGVQRMRELGVDDRVAWVLIPVLGLVLATVMLNAILYGLMPDEKWHMRFNPNQPARPSGIVAILGVMLALLVGAGVLMATIAFAAQRYFEVQAERAPASLGASIGQSQRDVQIEPRRSIE